MVCIKPWVPSLEQCKLGVVLLVLHLGLGTGLPEVQAHLRQLRKFKGYIRPCLKEKHIDKIMWSLSFDPHCYFNSICY